MQTDSCEQAKLTSNAWFHGQLSCQDLLTAMIFLLTHRDRNDSELDICSDPRHPGQTIAKNFRYRSMRGPDILENRAANLARSMEDDHRQRPPANRDLRKDVHEIPTLILTPAQRELAKTGELEKGTANWQIH
jgi:hypothetical protein